MNSPQQRKKRPQPERERPVRSWSTLFGANGDQVASVRNRVHHPPPAETKLDGSDAARAVTDSVGLGYRVIEEYLRQGQQVAQAFNPAGFGAAGFNAPSSPPSPDDLNQMSQRLMQYGWDFAGMWFEVWSKMAPGGVSSMAPFMPRPAERAVPADGGNGAAAQSRETVSVAAAAANADAGKRERVVVSVSCQRPTTAALDVRPGEVSALVVSALRAEGHEAPPIRDIAMERQPDGTLSLRVSIGAEQPAGIYNALILDPATNLPRGTLSVVIAGNADGGAI